MVDILQQEGITHANGKYVTSLIGNEACITQIGLGLLSVVGNHLE
jgi:hypothetical protein